MNLDEIIANTSALIFSNLEDGEIRIIKIIAKKGPQNSKQIGKITAKYAIGFDRWGVQDRVEGSSKFEGLIVNDYLYKKKMNKKETKYFLTLKGLFASLQSVKFENNYLIMSYRRKFERKIIDKKIVDWLLNYIKYEIALVLYFVEIQGLNWTRFKQTRLFIHNLKQNSEEILLPFYCNRKLIKSNQKTEYEFIKNGYLNLVIILKWINNIYKETEDDFKNYEHYIKQTKKRKTGELIHKSTYEWYVSLDGISKDVNEKLFSLFINKDSYYSTTNWIKTKQKLFSKTYQKLKTDGYEISNTNTMPT